MQQIPEFFQNITFAIENSPNCPSPYLARLVGDGGQLDYKRRSETGDPFGYGMTPAQALTSALLNSTKRSHQHLKDGLLDSLLELHQLPWKYECHEYRHEIVSTDGTRIAMFDDELTLAGIILRAEERAMKRKAA